MSEVKTLSYIRKIGAGKEDIKELRNMIARKEKLSTTVSELRDEKF